jgi:hypothetical protein
MMFPQLHAVPVVVAREPDNNGGLSDQRENTAI